MSISAELSNHQQTGGELANEYAHNTNNDVNATERQTWNSIRTRRKIVCAFYVGLALSATVLLICLLIKESTT